MIEAGSRIDKEVIVKEGVILPKQSIASCRTVLHAPGSALDFPMAEVDEAFFVKGRLITSVPDEMVLLPHQYMGQPGPYEHESDSSLGESDDEQIMAVMDDDKFQQ